MKEDWILEIRKSENRLFLLDYDGTLVNFRSFPEIAWPSWDLLSLLENLNSRSDTNVILISGRSSQSVDQLFLFPPFEIIAEHGMKRKKESQWTLIQPLIVGWKSSVRPLLEKYLSVLDGAFIEEKETGLAWHYRNCQVNMAETVVPGLIRELQEMAQQLNLKILDGNKVVEIVNRETGKGKIALKLASERKYDCILCIGDDETDEEMFTALNSLEYAYTVKVGDGSTEARYRLQSVEVVLKLLKILDE